MEIQKHILLFFAGFHGNLLNFIVQVITIFGEEFLLIALGVFIYWNVSKKKGFVTCFSLLVATNIMGVAKAIVRFPRPWLVIENLDTVRQSTATGYSFPSGHTTSAAGFFSAIALSFRKRWLSVICSVMIFLVGLSRMYLCVHWPLDVAGGLLIGCGTSMILVFRLGKLYDDKAKSIRITAITGGVFAVACAVVSILLMTDVVNALAFGDLSTTMAMFGGLGFGFALERKCFDFEVGSESRGKKIIRYLLGMAGILVLLFGLKALLKAIDLYNPLTRALRYMLIGFWGGIYPALGTKLKLFSNDKP